VADPRAKVVELQVPKAELAGYVAAVPSHVCAEHVPVTATVPDVPDADELQMADNVPT
jgi:hypothetical protein